jgi:hypothetical protein
MSVKIKATKTQETKPATASSTAQRLVLLQAVEKAHAPFYLMQKTLGNQAVQQWARSTGIQRKIKIGQTNDTYEQEADQVAAQVMKMPEPGIQRAPLCPECEEKKSISRNASGNCSGASYISSCVESHIMELEGKGQPLSSSTRKYFEPRFGSDFSNVRVNAGSDAAAIATEISAKAFTAGSDIFFGEGQYSPETTSGKYLLAHELTHVLQQRGSNINSCPMLQRAVSFKAKFENINLSSDLDANISGDYATVQDADFSADANVTAIGDSEVELNQWDIGILQDMLVDWDRVYWLRNNADKKGNFVEQKFKHVNTRYRDQSAGASTVWDDDSEHEMLNSVAKNPKGSKFEASTSITTSDGPFMPWPIDGSAVTDMDASDGQKNINIRRAGTRFDTYISAHNTVTGEWRHLGLLNWNYQRSSNFTGSGATLAVGAQTGQVGKHGPYGAGKYSPLLSGIAANTAINDSGNYYHRRVAGWT